MRYARANKPIHERSKIMSLDKSVCESNLSNMRDAPFTCPARKSVVALVGYLALTKIALDALFPSTR
jgi:hypothetical protein